jgi:amino acid adenylation domain-containing protein
MMVEHPTSYSQLRAWILDRWPGAVPNLTVSGFWVTGELREDRLADAVEATAARFPILSRRFCVDSTGTLVAFDEPYSERLVRDAPTGLAPTRQMMDAELVADASTRLDPEVDRLFTVRVKRFGSFAWYVGFVAHHIVADGPGLAFVVREVWSTYESSISRSSPSNRGAGTPSPPQNFDAIVAWERELEKQGSMSLRIAAIADRLGGVAYPSLRIGMSKPSGRPAVGRGLDVDLGGPYVDLCEAGRAAGYSRFTVTLTTIGMLARRLVADGSDVVVALTVSNRLAPIEHDNVGPFENVLPVCLPIARQDGFWKAIELCAAAVIDALEDHFVPLELITKALRPPRAPFQPPFSPIIVSAQDGIRTTISLDEGRLIVLPLSHSGGRSDYPLAFNIDSGGGTLHQLIYDARRISKTSAESIVQDWIAITQDALQPANLANEMPPRDSKVDGGTDPFRPPLESLVHHATADPERIAVIDDQGVMTFRELRDRSAALAGALTERGLAAGRVGVAIDAGRELIVALLGCLWSGAVYVPLAIHTSGSGSVPEAPPNLELIIRSDGSEARFSETIAACEIVTLADLLIAQRTTISALPVDQHMQPAYIMMTSGTTGRPKIIEISRSNLEVMLAAFSARLGPNKDDVVAHLTPPTFDISLLELLLPLCVGASTVTISKSGAWDPAEIVAWLVANRVTFVQATPLVWRSLLDAGLPPGLVRVGVSGGDTLHASLARRLASTVNVAFNAYGPTEATIWATCWRVAADADEVMIGRPFDGVIVEIRDPRGARSAPGVAGEILIGGHGVGRGYTDAPKLTAAAFVAGPDGSRLYRTGDFGRLHTSGAVEYLGRTDRQVKLRGHRVELSGVESAIESIPGVAEAVCAVSQDGTRLLAWVEPSGPDKLSSTRLRNNLSTRVAPHLVPNVFTIVASLPRTVHAKVDVAALSRFPVDDQECSGGNDDLAYLKDFLELCTDALEFDVGAGRMHFVEAGGTSLDAVRIQARWREQTQGVIPLERFFLEPELRTVVMPVDSG